MTGLQVIDFLKEHPNTGFIVEDVKETDSRRQFCKLRYNKPGYLITGWGTLKEVVHSYFFQYDMGYFIACSFGRFRILSDAEVTLALL